RETKAGLVVSCSFLCLVGVVVYSKLNEPATGGSEDRSERQLAELTAAPRPASPEGGQSSENPAAPQPLREGENHKTVNTGGIRPAGHLVSNEQDNSNSATSPKEPAPKPYGLPSLVIQKANDAAAPAAEPTPEGRLPTPRTTPTTSGAAAEGE